MAQENSSKMGVRSLRFMAVIGVWPEERLAPQPLEVDVSFEVLLPWPVGDDLAQTVSYAEIPRIVEAAAAKEPQLLETLAQDILDGVLAFDPRIEAAEVEVRKPQAITSSAGSFVVMRRER